MLERVLLGERLDHVELIFVPKAGTPITVEGNLSCTFKDGQPSVVRGIYRDITERKRVEEHLRRAERMQAAGKLAGGVAHEVNNMMTGVIGFSEFLLRSLEPERSPPGRRGGGHQGRHPRRRRDPPAAGVHPAAVPPPAGGARSTPSSSRWKRCCAAHWAKTSCSSSGSLPTPGQLRADRGQLEQVLINLVLNARDAMTGPWAGHHRDRQSRCGTRCTPSGTAGSRSRWAAT